MNALLFIFALEAGFLPNYGFVMYEAPQAVIADNSFYTDLEAQVEWHGFYVGGGMRTYMWKDQTGNGFWPFQVSNRFEAGWRNEWLGVGFLRLCEHPEIPQAAFDVPDQIWERAYTQVYVRVHGRIRLLKHKE